MSRRFLWLAIAIVAAIALYTFGWFYAADRLVAEADRMFDRLSRDGNRVTCENAEAVGYPFRIGLFCKSVFFERRVEGFAADAGAFRSAAQIYAPLHVVAELDPPARLNLPWSRPLHLQWQSLQASMRLARPLPERLSLVAAGLVAEVDAPGTENANMFGVERAQLHLRPAGADLEVGLRLDALRSGPLPGGGLLPPISAVGDIALTDGVLRIERRDFALPGSSFDVRRLEIAVQGGGMLTLSGPFSIGEDGLVDADLDVRASDAAALMAVLADAFPRIRSEMLTLGAGLGALGPDQALPLRIRDGVATLGFVELGRIPSL